MTASADGTAYTWAIAEGVEGCSYITAGAQNPIKYDAYELECALGRVSPWIGDEPYQGRLRSREEWESDLREVRAMLYRALEPLRSRRQINGQLTEE